MSNENVMAALEYGVESSGRPGEPLSGDLHVVRAISSGMLIGVIDGLGHGAEAATAARRAAETIEAHADEPIVSITRACDEQLKETRGAVIALAALDAWGGSLTWLSVGNVEGGLIHLNPATTPGYENLLMHPGVVGFRLPPLTVSVHPIARDDVLILSTDGIRNDFLHRVASDLRSAGRGEGGPAETLLRREGTAPQALATYIGMHYTKGSDDALVLVARILDH